MPVAAQQLAHRRAAADLGQLGVVGRRLAARRRSGCRLRLMATPPWRRIGWISSAQIGVSRASTSASSLGVEPTGVWPWAIIFSATAGSADHGFDLARQAVDDVGRRAGRRIGRDEQAEVEARDELLGEGRQLGHRGRALGAGDGQRLDAAGLDLRLGAGRARPGDVERAVATRPGSPARRRDRARGCSWPPSACSNIRP